METKELNIMETKELNLCELLEDHEGEEFYTTVYGNIKLTEVYNDGRDYPIVVNNGSFCLSKEGKYFDEGECVLFPSKEQRDWGKWAEEQKHKVPKIWEDITHCNVEIWQAISHLDYGAVEPVVKSALALLKIHQLIEVGYGGNITDEEWNNFDWKYKIYYSTEKNKLIIHGTTYRFPYCVFHTKKQAKEFISYPENMKLVKQFYMID